MKTYDEIVEDIHKRNEKLLQDFEGALKNSGLGQKTVNRHIDNISFFLNEYLAYQDISINDNEITLCNAEDGIDFVDDFLGYWFIRKATWSSENSIKSNITSIKKFYTFMQSLNLVSKEDLRNLTKEIKEGKNKWIAEVKRYDEMVMDY